MIFTDKRKQLKCIRGNESGGLIEGKIYNLLVDVTQGADWCGNCSGYIVDLPYPYVWDRDRFEEV